MYLAVNKTDTLLKKMQTLDGHLQLILPEILHLRKSGIRQLLSNRFMC